MGRAFPFPYPETNASIAIDYLTAKMIFKTCYVTFKKLYKHKTD
jgi:hypothetical protein